MNKSTMNGFSLMEVMVTVVIIGILAGIGYPNYTRYVAETRRSDATIALTRAAAQQEKFFTNCGVYTNVFTGNVAACTGLGIDTNSPDGHYILSVPVLVAGPAPLSLAGGGGFTLSAALNPLSPQAGADTTRCTTFTLNNFGAKGATGSESAANGGRCWKKPN